MPDLNLIRQQLDIAIRQALAREEITAIVSGNFHVEADNDETVFQPTGDCICPIGALLLGHHNRSGMIETAARLLGVNESWIWNFVFGFDNVQPTNAVLSYHGEPQLEAYALGQEYRARFVPAQVTK